MSEACKVILVGETGVGKTCIIVRFLNNEFYDGCPSTTGANYASKTLEFKEYNKKLQYDIWDTAGQEKYRGLARIFYKDATLAILVYDVTNRNSFEQIKEYWYNQVKDNGSANISKIILYKYIYILLKYLESPEIKLINFWRKKLLIKKEKNLLKKLVAFLKQHQQKLIQE